MNKEKKQRKQKRKIKAQNKNIVRTRQLENSDYKVYRLLNQHVKLYIVFGFMSIV